MKNKNLTAVLLLLALLSASGCRLLMRQLKPDFFAGNAAYTAAQAVKSKVVGGAFRVQSVEITEDAFKMKIEAPGNPQNIDEYAYAGVAAFGPNPLKFDAYDARTRERIPFGDIDFTVVPQIVQKALEKTQIQGGKVARMSFGGDIGKKIRWWIEIKGTRENASAWADAAGNITSTDLSQTARAADYKVLNEIELSKAAEAFKAKFGENAPVTKISVNETSIAFKVKSAQNPKTVDLYSFGIDGLKKSPLPGFPASPLEEEFPFGAVNLVDAVNLARKAAEKIAAPDDKLSSVYVGRFRSATGDGLNDFAQITWTVEFKRGIDDVRVSYDAELNRIE